MAVVYLGLGSNVNPRENLQLAVAELRSRFELKQVSPVYQSAALGFDGDDFLNAVTEIETTLQPPQLSRELEEIHQLAGRIRHSGKVLSRTLDIDVLLYGELVTDRLPRSDVLEYSFVLRPLADIAPDLRHPLTGRTMLDHWRDFDASHHPLTQFALNLWKPERRT